MLFICDGKSDIYPLLEGLKFLVIFMTDDGHKNHSYPIIGIGMSEI